MSPDSHCPSGGGVDQTLSPQGDIVPVMTERVRWGLRKGSRLSAEHLTPFGFLSPCAIFSASSICSLSHQTSEGQTDEVVCTTSARSCISHWSGACGGHARPRGAEAACPGPADGSGDTTAAAGGEQRVRHTPLSCSSFTASLAVLSWGTLSWPGLGA